MKVRYAKYKCEQCKAEDTDKIFSHEQPVPIINCWKCHAGLNIKNPAEQFAARKGMICVGMSA